MRFCLQIFFKFHIPFSLNEHIFWPQACLLLYTTFRFLQESNRKNRFIMLYLLKELELKKNQLCHNYLYQPRQPFDHKSNECIDVYQIKTWFPIQWISWPFKFTVFSTSIQITRNPNKDFQLIFVLLCVLLN